ncbi:hypothetical protein FACS1894201_00950 [Bacteroidia bacterium]|nr:hypothetical protein FACS1894201_00950 [Bacteroidia bacterium]
METITTGNPIEYRTTVLIPSDMMPVNITPPKTNFATSNKKPQVFHRFSWHKDTKYF